MTSSLDVKIYSLKHKFQLFIFYSHHRLSEFKTAEKYGQDIMEKINERNQIRRNGGNYSKVILTSIQTSVDHQAETLEGLK